MQTPSFGTQAAFDTGTNPVSVTAADVNGDGKPDLIVTNWLDNTVSVLLNTTAAGATVAGFAAQVAFATGGAPESVTTADVNGDGKNDIIVVDYGADSLSVLLNTATPGAVRASFADEVSFATGRYPLSLTAGDINGDAKPDLIVANGIDDTVSVLLNTTAVGAATPSFAAEHILRSALPKRLAKYGLTLHQEKTRLVDFRRPDRRALPSFDNGDARSRRGTFDLLGFTHYWARSRKGYWGVKQKTAADRFRHALKSIAGWCRRYRHAPVREQWTALERKLLGYFGYFGITGTFRAQRGFRHRVCGGWRKWLSRRSQRAQISWENMNRPLEHYPLPPPRLGRSARYVAKPWTEGRMRKSARPDPEPRGEYSPGATRP